MNARGVVGSGRQGLLAVNLPDAQKGVGDVERGGAEVPAIGWWISTTNYSRNIKLNRLKIGILII
jgi:hypothetical protein